LAYHGFASIDPRFGAHGMAFEIVDIFRNRSAQVAGGGTTNSQTRMGPWSVSINDATKPASDFAQSIERSTGTRASVKVRIMEFKLAEGSDAPTVEKDENLADLLESLNDDLEEKGFREPTRAEMANMPFQNPREQILGAVPYSQRDFLQRSMGEFSLRIDDKDDHCGKSAAVMVLLPAKGVKNDYGGLGITVVVFGPCPGSGGPERVASNLLRQESKILTDKLSEH
jgi:hypothetical protein